MFSRVLSKLYHFFSTPSVFLAAFWCLFISFGYASVTNADGRMETNDNFCHFLIGPTADDEVFQAGADSTITAVGGVADGYCQKNIRIPASHFTEADTKTITYTCEQIGTTCTLVESNGTAYTTQTCTSTISWRGRGKSLQAGFARAKATLACTGATAN